MRQTSMLKTKDVKKEWYVVDATGLTLGRMASQIAIMIKGKNKPSYTPHMDCGDNIIVVNAEKIALSGNKFNDKKYYRHSQYPSGLRVRTANEMLVKKPEFLVERAVRLMLPKGILGRKMYKNLFVYSGDKHPHEAQKPKILDLSKLGGN